MNNPSRISPAVSVRKQSRSLQNRFRRRKPIKKWSSSIIHVQIRPSIYQRQHRSLIITSVPRSNSTMMKSQHYASDRSPRNDRTTCSAASSQKSLVTNTSEKKEKDTWANTMDYRCKQLNNQKKKNNRKLKRQLKMMILLCILICVILPAVLLSLLLKSISKSKTRTIIKDDNVTLRWNTSGITVAGVSGMSGTQSNLLDNPWGLALTYENTLYIAERYNNRVQKYLRGSSDGTTVAGQANGTNCLGLQCLSQPSWVILDDSENMYIADAGHQRILFWRNSASTGTEIIGASFGSGSNQLTYPFSIARDTQTSTFYMSDYLNHRIMMYTEDSNSVVLVAGGNGSGNSINQLWNPTSIYLDHFTNSLIIANAGANNIVRWVLGEASWTLVAGSMNGSAGSSASLLHGPFGLTYDPMGNLYVADSGNNRIQFFSPGQTQGRTVAGVTGQTGYNSTLLNGPYGIILDNQLNLYIGDTWNNRVQKFLRY